MSIFREQEKNKEKAKSPPTCSPSTQDNTNLPRESVIDQGTIQMETLTPEVGSIDARHVSEIASNSRDKRRQGYNIWTDEQRFKIGIHTAEFGNRAAVKTYKSEFPTLNDSTVRSFKAKYYQEINQAAMGMRNPTKSIPKYSQPTGRPLMLGELDIMVQTYLRALSKRGEVVNTSVANATAKALISKYPNIVNPGVDIEY